MQRCSLLDDYVSLCYINTPIWAGVVLGQMQMFVLGQMQMFVLGQMQMFTF